MKAPALTIASLALVLTGVAGCGDDGGGGAPTDASAEDFCATFEGLGEEVGALGDDPDAAEVVEMFKAGAEDMAETGTPEDMPDDARAGFELIVSSIEDLSDDASLEDVEGLDSDFSESDQENSDALDEYLNETCDIG